MPRDTSFRDYVLEQLADLRFIRAKAMFGGYGIYADGVFFAVIGDGKIYFKTDDATTAPYLERGLSFFQISETQALKHYYEVPVDVLEDSDLLVEWARIAIQVAQRQAAQKPSPKPTPKRPAKG